MNLLGGLDALGASKKKKQPKKKPGPEPVGPTIDIPKAPSALPRSTPYILAVMGLAVVGVMLVRRMMR